MRLPIFKRARAVVRARCSRAAGARVVLLALALSLGLLAPMAPGAAASRSAHLGRVEYGILVKINEQRASFGLRPLRADAGLTNAAGEHSGDMARRWYYEHNTLRGVSWDARIHHFVRARIIGEVINLLWGRHHRHTEATLTVRAWMRSPMHRAVILDGRMRRVGIGRAGKRHGGQVFFYTADFAG